MRIAPTLVGLAAATCIGVPTAIPHAASDAAAVPAECGNPTITGTNGNDRLVGTSGDDVIVGGAGDDVILGGGGDDVLCGYSGADLLKGGYGDDRLYGGNDGLEEERGGGTYPLPDTLFGGPGDDLLDGGRDSRVPALSRDVVDFGTADGGVVVDLVALTATGQGADTLSDVRWDVNGGPYADRLLGTPGVDVMDGRGGADFLRGGAGDDYLEDSGTDRVADRIEGGPGRDNVLARGGSDTLVGGDNGDTITDYGLVGADRLYGGGGNDRVENRISARTGEYNDGGTGTDSISSWGSAAGATMRCVRFERFRDGGRCA